MWRALSDTEFDDRHGDDAPTGLVFSNPFPPGDMAEGDSRTLLVASPNRELLGAIAADFDANPELNIGEMPFEITDQTVIAPDVGEPGTKGVIETGTGVLVRIPPWKFDDYGIDVDSDQSEFWKEEHTLDPFQTQLENNLDWKHGHFAPDDLAGPSDTTGDLFDSYELIKTFPLPVTVTEGEQETWILSKWRFGYQVRDNDHRRHLNLALDTGIGERNAMGFGFVNIRESELEEPPV
ncbi:CRISPR-associated endoribonuclease Cas6 [Halobaculum sp. MBLA0147]|uniref:CRISPR-associated endoribonuclease Cas6 n=1 Tax=Halobaculum sp. MBLA0147 TaxID=3079934 RepID=UPI00352528CD